MKSLSTAFAALSLAFAGAVSAAPAPLSFSNHGLQDATGFGTAFSDTWTFTLASGGWLGGQLFTDTALGGAPMIDVQHVLLHRVGNSDVNWTETIAIDWNVAEDGVERWALSPRQVAAGQWQLIVSGVSYADKAGNGYDANLQLPEPQSVVLAALALLGAGLASLRRRSA